MKLKKKLSHAIYRISTARKFQKSIKHVENVDRKAIYCSIQNAAFRFWHIIMFDYYNRSKMGKRRLETRSGLYITRICRSD